MAPVLSSFSGIHRPPATADELSPPRAAKRSDGRRTTPARGLLGAARPDPGAGRLTGAAPSGQRFRGGVMVTVTEESTRDDLALCLAHLCEQAKHEARRGYAGIMGKRYADLHANMDLILTELLAR